MESQQFSSAKWDDFGLQLGLVNQTLLDIKENERGDPEKCLMSCLSAWLRRKDDVEKLGGPSWTALATALETIGEKVISNHIKQLYETPKVRGLTKGHIS